jgi:RNA polymerase sigma factor (sigma-70 family)
MSELAHQVKAAKQGDAYAREALARRSLTIALKTSTAVLGGGDGAEEVAQNVAIDVMRSLGRLRDPQAFDAWVHTITVRHAKRAIGRFARQRALIARLDPQDALPVADSSDQFALRDALSRALGELPAKQRIALVLRYVHDLPDEQIAEALGCRRGTVRTWLSRGRESMRSNPNIAELTTATIGGNR